MKHLHLLFAFIAASVIPAARAAADATPATDYSNWYQIEIIVFAQNQPSPSDETWNTPNLAYPSNMLAIAPLSDGDLKPFDLAQLEQLLGSPGTPEQTPSGKQQPPTYMFADMSRFKNAAPTQDTATPDQNANAAAEAQQAAEVKKIFDADLPAPFRALKRRDMHLNGVARSIRRSSLYRLLLHTAWLQPVVSEDDAHPVLVQAGDRYGNAFEVDGTLTVSLSRYLHVETDLWFTQFAQKYNEQPPLPPIVSNLDAATRARYPRLVAAEEKRNNFVKVQTYPMRQSRRMRSGTLHYLDNPYFGVLIQVDDFKYTPVGTQSPAPSPSP